MIFIPAYEISGTYNGSAIEQGLRNLQQQLNSLKAPKITPQVDMSNFFNQMDKAESYATKGRMGKMFSGVNFRSIGAEAGGQYASGMMYALGPIGPAAAGVATALGPIGLVAGAAAVGVGLLASQSVRAAMAWEDMKTSIGRTTGLDGKPLTDLMDSLQDLRMEMGVTREAAAGLVEQAGSIGVGQAKLNKGDIVGYKNELLEFTKATAILQGAWGGMSAEAVSGGIGRMGASTLAHWNAERREMGQQEMSWGEYAMTVGGTVDKLANEMGSSEEQIVTAMSSMSGAVSHWAPDETSYKKWLGLASLLISKTGQPSEVGTSFERFGTFVERNLSPISSMMGIDSETLRTKMKTDYVETAYEIAATIAAMPESERPDLNKMFGMEGKKLLDPLIADIEAGTGEYQDAIAKALTPSDVSEGWDKVADDASKAFDRIGQAWQVSMEQAGGVILPIVTDIANAIADSWQGMNVAGTEIWKAGAGIVENLSQGNLGDVTFNGELYNVSLSGIRKKTAEEIEAGAKEGADSASAEVAESLASGISEEMNKKMEEFAAGQDAYIKSHSGGMSVSNLYDTGERDANGKAIFEQGDTRIIGGDDDTEKKYEKQWNRILTTFPDTYSMQKMVKTTGQSSGYLSLLGANGDELKRLQFGAKHGYADSADAERAMEEMVKPVILDMPKYMKSVSGDMKSVLEDVTKDGIIAPLTEKPLLEGYLESLKNLEKEYPVQFTAEGLDKIASDIQATLDGKPYTIDVKAELDETDFTANFALWKKENAGLYEKIYATTGQIPTGTEQEARFRYEQKLAEDGSEKSKSILQWLDEWDSALENSDFSSYDAIGSRLMELDPNLANQKWFTQTLDTAAKDIANNFKIVGDALVPVGDNAKTLAGSFADAASMLAVAKGSLQAAATNARATAGMDWWKSTVSQINTQNHLVKPASLMSAKTEPLDLNFKKFAGKLNYPKLAEGGKVTGSGLAWIGEAGTEFVIPEGDIKGLYPPSAAVDKGSMSYLTGGRYFDDYPHTVRTESYRRSQFPNAPPVTTTGNEPSAWLSDPQTTGNEWISSEIRSAQLSAMGLTEDNVLKSPKVAKELTNRDMWNAIYDNSGTCIAFVEPDPSLNFTPGKNYMPGGKGYGNLDKPLYGNDGAGYGAAISHIASVLGGSGGQWLTDKDAIAATSTTSSDGLVMPAGVVSNALTNRTAWNAIYDNKGTCIAFVEPDPSLNFTPGADYLPGGKGLGNMGGGYTSLGDQEVSGWDSVAEASWANAEETKKVEENTRKISTSTSTVADGLVMGGYGGAYGSGGGSIIGLANRGGGAVWGGTSVSGMGGWVGSGRSATGWGAQAVSGSSGSFGGSSGWGSVKWAKGGFSDGPVYGVFGEAGREAFVPISDRAAGLRVLPQVLQELGVATFASGGIVGSGRSGGSAAAGVSINYAPTIHGSGMSESQLKRILKESGNDMIQKIERKFYEGKR